MFLVSSDNQHGLNHGLSSSQAIYTIRSVVKEYSGILSRSRVGVGGSTLQNCALRRHFLG